MSRHQKELKQILMRAHADLVKQIDPDHGLLREMLSKGVLSSAQIETCQSKSTRCGRVDTMLYMLRELVAIDKHFKTFCDLLVEINRQDIVEDYLKDGLALLEDRPVSERNAITQNGVNTSASSANAAKTSAGCCSNSSTEEREPRTFEEAFKGMHDYLLDKIDAKTSLLSKLEDKGVLLHRQVEECQITEPQAKCVQKLLDFLHRQDDEEHLRQFVAALNESNQQHVAKVVMKPRVYRAN